MCELGGKKNKTYFPHSLQKEPAMNLKKKKNWSVKIDSLRSTTLFSVLFSTRQAERAVPHRKGRGR